MQTDYKFSWILRSNGKTKVLARFYEADNYEPPEGGAVDRKFLREQIYEFDNTQTDGQLRYFFNEELKKGATRIPITKQRNGIR